MLSSSLFYESTLQCRVPDSKGHPNAPFPLIFVCSSVQQDINCTPGKNEKEAKILVKQLVKYIQQYPINWVQGGRRPHVCVMSPSANQVI